jgi:hypothetical protein
VVVTNIFRRDSKSTDPLQLVDIMASGVTCEFHQTVGLAGQGSSKALLVDKLRTAFNVTSFLEGCREGQLNVQLYRDE